MESAGMEFARMINNRKKPDLVMATNLMDLAQWKVYSGWGEIPHILYVHENQLDYPLNEGEKRDFHYVWKDYSNFLIGDKLIFNSQYNLDSFCHKFKRFSRSLPDCNPIDPENIIRNKSVIISPGCSIIERNDLQNLKMKKNESPLFLWNHRWEHDKNPEDFFSLLKKLKNKTIPFRLALLGESFKDSPSCFHEAKSLFKEEIVHYGFVQSRKDYEMWLKKADFVVTTARQENFGISMVEAMSAGVLPLMPDRLAYPEVLPREFHKDCLYTHEEDLFEKLCLLMDHPDLNLLREKLILKMVRYGWEEIILELNALIDETLEISGLK